MHHGLKLGALAVAAAFAAAPAAALEVANVSGWKIDISGSVNAFYTNTKADNKNTSASVENGLLPGYLNVAATTQQQGYDVKVQVGYWPGISSTGAAKTTSDFRTTYFTIGTPNAGTFKFGRDIGLFEQNEILTDMTLIGVGGGAGLARNINTTLGGIGAGYNYAEFQSQLTYTTPKLGGLFSASIGVFDNKDYTDPNATQNVGSTPGIQALAEVAPNVPCFGKAWLGFIQQKFVGGGSFQSSTVNGYDVGAKGDCGPGNMFGWVASYYGGDGLGSVITFSNGFDANGGKRKSNGYLVQATVKPIPNVKLGYSHGLSKVEGTSLDGGGNVYKTVGDTLGVYWNIIPAVTLVGEYNIRKNQAVAGDPKAKTFSIGGIVFF